MDVIKEKLKLLPNNAGVYVMLDKNGQVIYVGKAKVLKNRVRQYFFKSNKPEKVSAMVNNVADFYYYITPSEIDALSLENNLIKKYKPRYNILLKDDKTYPYLKINLKEKYPKFKIVRRLKNDGAKYFGPYMAGISVNKVLDIINGVFMIRPCDKNIDLCVSKKPCLNHQLKRCLAPCAGLVSESDYRNQVNKAIKFLSGDILSTRQILEQKMLACANNEEFELALKYKEYLACLNQIGIKRLTSLSSFLSADIISCYDNNIYTAFSVLIVRNGIMIGGKNFSFETGSFTHGEALREFVLRYYHEGVELPREIITCEQVEDAQIVKEYLTEVFGKKADITSAKQGVKHELVKMATDNAKNYLLTNIDKIKHKQDMTVIACRSLKDKLGLKNYPKRMECYDISNISGVDKVGSMVVFIDGEADKNLYRRFKIKTFEGADDFRSLKEVLHRRLEKMVSEPDKFSKPDLIIIDGGKGQLSSVNEIFESHNVKDIDLISLAKREEEVFLPNKSKSIMLPRGSSALFLIQRVRDEAHRFAITYHRNLRSKALKKD